MNQREQQRKYSARQNFHKMFASFFLNPHNDLVLLNSRQTVKLFSFVRLSDWMFLYKKVPGLSSETYVGSGRQQNGEIRRSDRYQWDYPSVRFTAH
jgi:hypothetical protein